MILERMLMRGKCLVDVDAIRGRSFRYCKRNLNVDTLNRQILAWPTLRYPNVRSWYGHSQFHKRSLFNSASFVPIGHIMQLDNDRDNNQPYKKRNEQLRNIGVSENVVNREKLYYRLQQSRCSGINPSDTSKTTSSANETSSNSLGNIAESKSNRGTDPAFASYLTGELKPQSILNELTKLSATSILNQRRTAAAKRSRSFALDTNNDKELYRQITDFQILQKEKSHRKTAFNVNRALIGNVIICTGKFCYETSFLNYTMPLLISKPCNVSISIAKLGAWISSGSSAMLAEFIHSVVDCGNQALLLIGLRDSSLAADRSHPYGYGKSIYFWALVSALGTFFLGAGVSMTHAVGDLMNPSLHQITWEVWAVLSLSFCIDGYVLNQTIKEIIESKPSGVTYWKHIMRLRDPATLAVLLEDGAACLGIVFAIAGIAASHYTGNPIFDGIAGVGISTLLGVMGIALVRVNHSFLLGQAVDREIVDDIGKILLNRRSIDSIRSVQSQWTGPESFSYKAEVDFDGTYLAAKLMPIYQQEFIQIKDSMDDELQVLLALYAEDVMRTVEREVRQVEAQIRMKYPGAEYIELEPMSVDADRLAIDDNLEGELRRVESDALNRYLKSLKSEAATSKSDSESKAPDSSIR